MRIPHLTLPKLISAGLLLALGVNGVIEVGLQRDMAAKTSTLQYQVAQSENLSKSMNSGLTGLSELQQTTQTMAGSLAAVQSTTADMDNGLHTLYASVSGINQAVIKIVDSTAASKQEIAQTTATIDAMLQTLHGLIQTNNNVISHLQDMKSSQASINANLEQMNRKTSVLP